MAAFVRNIVDVGSETRPNLWSANSNERLDKQKSDASNPVLLQSVQLVLL